MQQLDKKAVWFFFISFSLHWFIFIIFFSVWGLTLLNGFNENIDKGQLSFSFINWLWIIIPVYLTLCYLWALLSYKNYRYQLTDAGFRKELGVIYKKSVTIPYDRIQNVDIYRGILARLLGLSDLNIQTAGMSASVNRYGIAGTASEGRLPALSHQTAEQIRDQLIQRINPSKNQGL